MLVLVAPGLRISGQVAHSWPAPVRLNPLQSALFAGVLIFGANWQSEGRGFNPRQLHQILPLTSDWQPHHSLTDPEGCLALAYQKMVGQQLGQVNQLSENGVRV